MKNVILKIQSQKNRKANKPSEVNFQKIAKINSGRKSWKY